ncbi:MAG: cobalt ECF transporter T component CbiQ [Desulfobulbus sp.]
MNETAPCLITLSWGPSLLLVCGLLAPLALSALWAIRHWKHRPAAVQGLLPDWSVPTIDPDTHEGDGLSPLHTWHPGMKIGVLLGCCFLIAGLRSTTCSIIALLCALLLVRLARISWHRPLNRLAALTGLLGILLIILPVTAPLLPGDTALILVSPALPTVRVQGLQLALTILFKSAAIALMVDPMLATAPLSRTMQGFTALGVPPSLMQMILLCHRYLFVFIDEGRQIHRAMQLRGFQPRTNLATMRIAGSCVGILCIRAFERTQRIHEAMLCRGYQGKLPATDLAPLRAVDGWKGAFFLLPVLLLVLCDRIVRPW